MTRGRKPSPRLPFEPLERLYAATHGRNACAMARRVGIDRQAVYRGRTDGLSEALADRWAVALGWHPAEVWGAAWWSL